MQNISRRGFMGAAGVLAAMSTLGVSAAYADEAAAADFVPGGGSYAEGALDLGWTGTPEAIAAAGNSTMPLAELNRRRRAYIDAQTEYTCADGTVIPLGYVRLRAVFNTYGMGCGNAPADSSFVYMVNDLTEEQAGFLANCPLGVDFGVYEASAATGYPVETCREWLDHAVYMGYMKSFHNNEGVRYSHMGYFQGAAEVLEWRGVSDLFPNDPLEMSGDCGLTGATVTGENYAADLANGGSQQFRTVPCFEDVVGDERILPLEDIRKILANAGTVGIAPCLCRYRFALATGDAELPAWSEFIAGGQSEYTMASNGFRVETCIAMGDEAEYWINKGFARRATPEEALALLERNMEDGYVPSAINNTACETICSCHPSIGCGILGLWSMFGDSLPYIPMGRQASFYNLEVDFESCLKCGICSQRCPLGAITMDGEDGYPAVAGKCLKCGQCAHVCPQGARKLYARPEEENYQLPANMLEDNNMKAAWRFEHGAII